MVEELMSSYGSRMVVAIIGVGLAFLCLIGILWLLRGRRGSSPFVRGGRNRQPRLQVLDAAAVDARRRLVLVRRDDVEHLIMIGGPTDLVVESRIVPAAPPRQSADTALQADATSDTRTSSPTPSPVPSRPPHELAAPPARPEAPQPRAARPVSEPSRFEPAIEPVVREPIRREPARPAVAAAAAPASPARSEAAVTAPTPVVKPQPPVPQPVAAPPAIQPAAVYPAPMAAIEASESLLQPAALRPAPQPVQPPLPVTPPRPDEALRALEAARDRVLPEPPSTQRVVPIHAAAISPALEAAAEKPKVLGSEFDRILEEEMAQNLAHREPGAAETVKREMPPRDPSTPPITGATPAPSLQDEVARIFGEMSARRDP